ncbi:MAG: flagellar basal body L-ring protein FlgH, partial [Pseudomonadota bacterium]
MSIQGSTDSVLTTWHSALFQHWWRSVAGFSALLLCSACAPTIVYEKPLPEPVKPVFEDPLPNGAIYQESNHRLLFEDLKARRQGDLITVILDERTNAEKNA